MITQTTITSHSCKRDRHEDCALTYLITRKTGNLVPMETKASSQTELVPEGEITATLECICPCHEPQRPK